MRLIDADVMMDSLNNMKVSGETFTTAVEFSKKIIENAPTVGGWISVKDRLPEDETVIIAYVQHKIGWYRMFAWHDMYGWHSSAPEFDEKESDYVTHWMPLPEPPSNDPHKEET